MAVLFENTSRFNVGGIHRVVLSSHGRLLTLDSSRLASSLGGIGRIWRRDVG